MVAFSDKFGVALLRDHNNKSRRIGVGPEERFATNRRELKSSFIFF